MKPYKRQFKESILTTTTEVDTEYLDDASILRIGISSEQSAVTLYERLAKSTTSVKLKKVLLDVAREEKVHIAEFQSMLDMVDKEEIDTRNEGYDEVEEI